MRRLLPAAVFLAVFALHLHHAFPGLSSFRDAGDLAAAAGTLGVAHPPGYPAYVLLGRAAQGVLLLANPAYRLNVLSALLGAGAVLFVFLILFRRASLPAAAAGAALAAVFPPALAQSVMSEVYALNAFLAAGLLWGAIEAGPPTEHPRRWTALAFAFGLGLGNHHTLALVLPALAAVAWRDRAIFRFPYRAAALAALAGLSLSLFPLFRAWAGAEHAWGEPGTLSGLWDLLRRADYGSGTLSTRHSTAGPSEGMAFFFRVWVWQWGALGAALGGAGLLLAFRRAANRAWGAPVLVLWVCSGPLFAAAARLRPGDLSLAVLQPALVVPALAWALAAGFLCDALWRRNAAFRLAAAALFLAFAAYKGAPAALAGDRRWDTLAPDYGRNLLRSVPPGSVLLMITDAAVFTTAYERSLGRRPDVRPVVDARLPWRWRRYRRSDPDLFVEGQPDGGASLARLHGARRPVFTEGLQPGLEDSLCPSGLAARVDLPQRGDACLDELERRPWLWGLYTRRLPRPRVLLDDYYSRALLQTVSSGGFNAGLLLAKAGREGPARTYYAHALFWNPDRLLRWGESF
jgi:hypothetical protein